MGLLARLSRIVPLLIILALLAAVLYVVVSYRRSPARAKEILIQSFTWICGAIAAFFGIVSLYALFEGNRAVLDLAASFMAVGLVGLVIVRCCNHVFLKNNPAYKKKPQKARVHHRWPWER